MSAYAFRACIITWTSGVGDSLITAPVFVSRMRTTVSCVVGSTMYWAYAGRRLPPVAATTVLALGCRRSAVAFAVLSRIAASGSFNHVAGFGPEGTPAVTAKTFEGLLREGVVKDYAELSRLGQVSRARVTQIMNLLNLASDIQEEIMSWVGERSGKQSVRETSVRALSSEVSWSRQREQWRRWSSNP